MGLKFCLAFACPLPAPAQADSFDRPHSARAAPGRANNILDEPKFKEIRILNEPKFQKIREEAEDCIKTWAPDLVLSGKIQSEGGLSQALEALAALCAIRITGGPPEDSRGFSPQEALLAQAVWGTTDGASQGTGFFIEAETASGPARYFVTNFHIIRAQWANGADSSFIFLYQEDGRIETALIKRVFLSALHDLALLEMSENIPGGALKIRDSAVSPHEPVFSIGFRGSILKKTSQKQPLFGRPDLDLTEGGAVLWFEAEGKASRGGASGSPVFDQQGRVVAAVHKATSQNSSLGSFYVSASASRNIQKILAGELGSDCAHFIGRAACMEGEIKNLERMAARGRAAAQIELAYMLQEKGDIEGFKNWLHKAAEQNHGTAQKMLWGLYLAGPDPAFEGGRDGAEAGFLSGLRQAFYWYLRYRLNFLWEIRARAGAEDGEMPAAP